MLPFDPDEVHIEPSKHFRNLRMRKWNWDVNDLRDALRAPIKVVPRGRRKIEVWVREGGSKKLVVSHITEENLVLVITGTEG
ncbi:MAG: hypothetical protein L3K17_06510 [Thermoplasmata archaeon]|nr:hypothetical protein [Thermoplasmata archaeon]